ncbi:hypothetical protein RB195_020748 [Necator americanus]|uniref:Uncharacterized protein n=1 Tax=Necator americanus TaxID=51031 RepID=A0ABR1CLZ3_NECAM
MLIVIVADAGVGTPASSSAIILINLLFSGKNGPVSIKERFYVDLHRATTPESKNSDSESTSRDQRAFRHRCIV